MKTRTRACFLLAIIASAAMTDAASAAPKRPKKRTRTVTFEYRAGPVFSVDGIGNGAVCKVDDVAVASCTEVPLKADEHYVKIVATDATGLPVGIQWHEGALPTFDQGNGYGGVKIVCGSAAGKLRKPKQIVVYVGPVMSDCPVATLGTVVVTISNLP